MRENNPGVSRRSLLKAAGAVSAAGMTALSAQEADGFQLLSTPEALPPDRSIPSFCELCFWNCGLFAHVRRNTILSLTGHPQYPNAKGKLCGRGNAGAGFVRDKDRLKYPMVRVGKRGEGRFERIGWPTAYKLIAERFGNIKAKWGAQSLALFYHGKGGPLLRTALVAYGSPNYAAPSYAQCKAPRDVGFKLTFGEKLTSPEPLDFDNTKLMVFFGSHLGENAHNSQVQEFSDALARGAKLVVLDPRYSTAASKATLWLPIRPGTDTAIILAWLHLFTARGTYHKEFVENQCIGLDELAAHVKDFTPEWAATHTGVPAEMITAAYDLMREAMPAVLIHPGRHVSWYGEADTQRARAQAILCALLGSFWAPGGIFRPSSPELGDFPTPELPDLPPHVDEAAKRYPFALEVTTNGIREATRTGKPYPIKGWFVHGTNLIQSIPNVKETVEAIGQLDTLVVCDIQPTEITNYADILLPEDTYLERYDDLAAGPGLAPYIGIRQPVVKSTHDTRPAWRIAKELATALGVGDFFAFDSFDEYLAARLAPTGVSLEKLKQDGIAFVKPKFPPYLDPAEEFHWHTPSGKVELFSKQLEEKGFSPLPLFIPQPDPPPGTLRLLYGRSPLHTFGRTQNNDILSDLDPTNNLWMHPDLAKQLGIEEGRCVLIENADGATSGHLQARITSRVMPGTVYMIHGFGHTSKELTRTYGMGGADSEVIERYAVDPISGATGMRTEFVKIKIAPRTGRRMPCDKP